MRKLILFALLWPLLSYAQVPFLVTSSNRFFPDTFQTISVPAKTAAGTIYSITLTKYNLNINDGGDSALWYDDDSATYNIIYGRIYSYNAAIRIINKISGNYSLPTRDEMLDVERFFTRSGIAVGGQKLKSVSGWNSGNGLDSCGFNAKPGGWKLNGGYWDRGGAIRLWHNTYTFNNIHYYGSYVFTINDPISWNLQSSYTQMMHYVRLKKQ